MYVGTGCIIAIFLIAYYWAWNEPARELERRTPVKEALSRDEARRVGLSQISYGQLGFAVLVAFWLPFTQSEKRDILHGWGRLWLVFASLIIVLVAVQAYRKWQSERSS